MNDIVAKLKKKLLLHSKVNKSILSNSPIWKRSHYIFLSELIELELGDSPFMTLEKKREIGTSISHSTLQRIFSSKTEEKFTNDLRFIKTLDKFCIFLGYKNLNDFLFSVDEEEETKKEEKIMENETDLPPDYFFTIIKQYCYEEFEYLKKLPNTDLSNLNKYCFENGPFMNRIKRNYEEFGKLDYFLSQDNNQSNYELYNFRSLTLEKEFAVISVKEFWNLYFTNEQEKKTKYISHVAYHLYQMHLAKAEVLKMKENNPDLQEPQDPQMQDEINRVASTLIRLMDVMR